MRHRGYMPGEERAIRSRLAKLVHEEVLVRGGLVRMSRRCGKPGCKCTRGEEHVSLYLSARVGRSRRMIYVPGAWEERVEVWVRRYREASELMEKLSERALERFLKETGR